MAATSTPAVEAPALLLFVPGDITLLYACAGVITGNLELELVIAPALLLVILVFVRNVPIRAEDAPDVFFVGVTFDSDCGTTFVFALLPNIRTDGAANTVIGKINKANTKNFFICIILGYFTNSFINGS